MPASGPNDELHAEDLRIIAMIAQLINIRAHSTGRPARDGEVVGQLQRPPRRSTDQSQCTCNAGDDDSCDRAGN